MFVDLIELAAFNQKPDLRLGTGVAEKNATFASQLALDFLAQLDYFAEFLDRLEATDPTLWASWEYGSATRLLYRAHAALMARPLRSRGQPGT